MRAPPEYKALHPLGAAPVITDGDLVLAEFFSLTTMRYFLPTDFTPYPHILSYLRRIGEREAYRRAMRKGDPDMAPLLT